MNVTGKPWWQQATALVSLGASGAVTGLSLLPATAASASPTGAHIRLLAFKQSAQPAPTGDATLRSAIVNVAEYYLRMAGSKTPAEMEAIIWQHDSIDGVDHGASCAAFASLTLELAAQVVGQQSWVTGGTTYPWPLHKWADVRVDPNSASPGIASVLQDARANHRWHPLGDGYRPQPGDWVLFDGHVEVVTKYADGSLSTIGGDSGPDLSVNAHAYPGPLAGQGVAGFVNNGDLPSASGPATGGGSQAATGSSQAAGDDQLLDQSAAAGAAGTAAIPGVPAAGSASSGLAGSAQAATHRARGVRPPHPSHRSSRPLHARASRGGRPAMLAGDGRGGEADVPGTLFPRSAVSSGAAGPEAAAIPGLPVAAHAPSADAATSATRYVRHDPSPPGASGPGASGPGAAGADASDQRAFIAAVAPGAMASQRRYGVPAAVTIAQAIDESGWGQSTLATDDHNLFGIKGTGPAGSDTQLTQEYEQGQPVSRSAAFRVYRNVAESIDDHGRLLATSGYYGQAMAQRRNPDAFASSLTGVYATAPDYGARLIDLMQRYDLYRYDASARPAPHASAPAPHAAAPAPRAAAPAAAQTAAPPAAAPGAAAIPGMPARPPAPAHTAPRARKVRPPVSPPRSTPITSTPRTSPGAPASSTPPIASAPGTSPAAPASGTTPGATARGTSAAARGSGPASRPSAPRTTPGITAASGGSAIPVPGFSAATSGSRTSRSASAAGSSSATSTPRTSPRAAAPDVAPAASGAAASKTTAAVTTPRTTRSVQTMAAERLTAPSDYPAQRITPRSLPAGPSRYQEQFPPSVRNGIMARVRGPLTREEPLYRDVASHSGVRWELLAACDWMQCEARPRYSPVHGEKLGTVNPDGSVYRTRSAALEQCADDLVELARTVYWIDLTSSRRDLSIRDLANVFAAFRWGGLLRLHHTSAMEFPYSVAGLTSGHLSMRWPNIDEPNAPDKPGGRFHMPFGAVPIVLSLGYPATV
ncbi:MAG TPA: glucosaminidase domain-containing protein [Streptosporangiaceae bacterium]